MACASELCPPIPRVGSTSWDDAALAFQYAECAARHQLDYRTLLRDVPLQSGFPQSIDWPQAPVWRQAHNFDRIPSPLLRAFFGVPSMGTLLWLRVPP